jgi:hypothetical protein
MGGRFSQNGGNWRGLILMVTCGEFDGHRRWRVPDESSTCDAPLLLRLLLSEEGTLIALGIAMIALQSSTPRNRK